MEPQTSISLSSLNAPFWAELCLGSKFLFYFIFFELWTGLISHLSLFICFVKQEKILQVQWLVLEGSLRRSHMCHLHGLLISLSYLPIPAALAVYVPFPSTFFLDVYMFMFLFFFFHLIVVFLSQNLIFHSRVILIVLKHWLFWWKFWFWFLLPLQASTLLWESRVLILFLKSFYQFINLIILLLNFVCISFPLPYTNGNFPIFHKELKFG